jgi:outer membrane protein OmpA-like peptidoglycan-associated protein
MDWELREALKDPIVFLPDNPQLNPREKNVVNKIATILKQYPSVPVSITGHTSTDLLDMSQERADSVAKELRKLGCENQMITVGWSDEHPTIGHWTGVLVCVASEAVQTSEELKLALREPVAFVEDHPELHPSERSVIKNIAHVLRKYPSVHVTVNGHTSVDLLELSQARADNVVRELQRLGCRSPMAAIGWSDTHPRVGQWTGVVVKASHYPAQLFDTAPCCDTFPRDDAERMPARCHHRCLDRCRREGFGGFVVIGDTAFFKRQSAEECRSQRQENKRACLYTLAKPA